MKRKLKRLWKQLCAKENWESRMSWDFYVLIFVGSLIAGLGNLF